MMKKKRYLLCLPLAVLAVLFIWRVVYINKKYPSPVMEYYTIGQTVKKDGFEIKVDGVEYMSYDEMKEICHYPANMITSSKELGEGKYVVATVTIHNMRGEAARFSYDQITARIQNMATAIDIFSNGGLNPDGMPINYTADQKKIVRLGFGFWESNCEPEVWKEFEKQKLTITLSVYPIQRLVEIPEKENS